jgi:hypothetical protein
LGLPAWNFHVQDCQVAVSGMPFDLSHAVTGCSQNLGQLNSFAGDEGRQLLAKSQALLNGYSESGLEVEADLAAEHEGVVEVVTAARVDDILNVRLEKERGLPQGNAVRPFQD